MGLTPAETESEFTYQYDKNVIPGHITVQIHCCGVNTMCFCIKLNTVLLVEYCHSVATRHCMILIFDYDIPIDEWVESTKCYREEQNLQN
jgi:hypothetical protein